MPTPHCNFVHIGVTCKLDKEIEFLHQRGLSANGHHLPQQNSGCFGSTGVVLTDCDYTLLLNGQETTHHFMVTEVYNKTAEEWKLVTLLLYGVGLLRRAARKTFSLQNTESRQVFMPVGLPWKGESYA